ncbi:aspartate carbamoyltransferase catalytic subunit [Psychromarinibacter sp. C21-152]|uniref:Aspartate carbamoyltransferase catalytic subunit n=1 Tax=Psychromarinibacter sediminicola TaxID=3033385 RepID=A0AAE3T9I5_9RHOB|nr:aspartate carbamoyltransferase catalytic subunit [Psychromarinibacter sediminicola]MDF0601059.1 aspartate carbamoyltransferase catalytic subunit [Psychromarinibacter sediminicola]
MSDLSDDAPVPARDAPVDKTAADPVPAGWEGILDAGERILWQGRPGTSVVWKASHILTSLFGVVFAGFAVFWMVMASQAPGGFWMFGLIHFAVGVGLAIGPPVWSAWTRRHTWYTLTDRRAFIATDLPLQGRKLKSYEIGPDTTIDYEAGERSNIYFAHEYKRTKNGSRRVPIGFERIPDGAEVYRLIRQVQSRKA